MFTVHFTLCIWTHSEDVVADDFERERHDAKVAILCRTVELAFPPYPGLVVVDGGWESGLIQQVQWNIPKSAFTCSVADKFPRIVNGSDLNFEFLLDHAILTGWNRSEYGGGWDAPRR
jgi:hypothetical protein